MQSDTQPTTPAGALALVSQREECEGDSAIVVSRFPSLWSLDNQDPHILGDRAHKVHSPTWIFQVRLLLSVWVLKTFSEGSSRTSLSNSRNVSPSTELQAAPRFGKGMRVLCMSRPYDIAGEFTMDFHLDDLDNIAVWVRAPASVGCVFVVLLFLSHPDPWCLPSQYRHLSGEMYLASLLLYPRPLSTYHGTG